MTFSRPMFSSVRSCERTGYLILQPLPKSLVDLTASWTRENARIRLLRFLHRAVEREFSDERWGLIEIAVADPLWPYDEVHNPWPSEPGRSVSPYSEVHVLASS